MKEVDEVNMKVEVGDIIEIKGKQAIVCFETIYNDENYICVAFEEDSIAYDIYKWRINNDKLQVAKVENNQELSHVLSVFLKESVEENPDKENLEGILSKIAEKLKESNEGE